MAATVGGDAGTGGVLSYLPGQRLSRCTCQGESHPGPKHKDGTFVGRSAPEIDVFEAQVERHNLSRKMGQLISFEDQSKFTHPRGFSICSVGREHYLADH